MYSKLQKKHTVIACTTTCGSWWFKRLTMDLIQSFGPFAVVVILSQISRIKAQSSLVLVSNVAFTVNYTNISIVSSANCTLSHIFFWRIIWKKKKDNIIVITYDFVERWGIAKDAHITPTTQW
jgi:hypothetical protein